MMSVVKIPHISHVAADASVEPRFHPASVTLRHKSLATSTGNTATTVSDPSINQLVPDIYTNTLSSSVSRLMNSVVNQLWTQTKCEVNLDGSSAAISSDRVPAVFSLPTICSSSVSADGTSTLMSSMSINIRLMP